MMDPPEEVNGWRLKKSAVGHIYYGGNEYVAIEAYCLMSGYTIALTSPVYFQKEIVKSGVDGRELTIKEMVALMEDWQPEEIPDLMETLQYQQGEYDDVDVQTVETGPDVDVGSSSMDDFLDG